MGVYDWLAGIGAQDEQNAMGQNNAQITRSIAPGSGFYTTDATGAGATALSQQAAALAQKKAKADWTAANASGAQLSGIAGQAAQMGLSGGRQGQAAIDTAQAQIANTGGGLGGLKAVGTMGAQAGTNAAGIAQNESSNFLNQASTYNNAVSSAKLQQLVVNAALNHANRQSAIGAQNVGYGVTNLQNQTATQLNSSAMQAGRARDGLGIAQSNAEYAAALANATALVTAASKGAGAISGAIGGGSSDGTSATSDYAQNLGTPQLQTDPSLGLNTPDYSTASLTDPTANGLNLPATQNNSSNQLALDQALFSTPSNIFGVY